MNIYNDIFRRIKKAAASEPKSIDQEFLKLMEEVGESSQAYLSSEKASGANYKHLTVYNTKEELVDVLLVTLALLQKLGTTDDELNKLLLKKVSKWIDKQI